MIAIYVYPRNNKDARYFLVGTSNRLIEIPTHFVLKSIIDLFASQLLAVLVRLVATVLAAVCSVAAVVFYKELDS